MGDTADVSQAVAYYISVVCALYIFCWLGNELSNLVRISGIVALSFRINYFFNALKAKYTLHSITVTTFLLITNIKSPSSSKELTVRIYRIRKHLG
jgi:hypothetical protein